MKHRDEFNLQGLDPIRTACTAGLLALPGILAAGYQYGWQGIAVASLFTAGLTHRINSYSAAKTDQKTPAPVFTPDDDDDDKIETGPLENRLQAWVNATTDQLGIAPVTVRIVDKPQALARANIYTRQIEVGYWVTHLLNERELTWVVAHELDHIRHPNDAKAGAAFCAAKQVNLGLLGTSIFGFIGAPTLSQGFIGALGLSYIIMDTSLQHVDAALSRQNEYRCDANALRLTGDRDAAQGALHKIWYQTERMGALEKVLFRMQLSEDDEFITFEIPETPLKKSFWEQTKEFVTGGITRTHPDLARRIDNVERTWKKMQAEGLAAPQPPHA